MHRQHRRVRRVPLPSGRRHVKEERPAPFATMPAASPRRAVDEVHGVHHTNVQSTVSGTARVRQATGSPARGGRITGLRRPARGGRRRLCQRNLPSAEILGCRPIITDGDDAPPSRRPLTSSSESSRGARRGGQRSRDDERQLMPRKIMTRRPWGGLRVPCPVRGWSIHPSHRRRVVGRGGGGGRSCRAHEGRGVEESIAEVDIGLSPPAGVILRAFAVAGFALFEDLHALVAQVAQDLAGDARDAPFISASSMPSVARPGVPTRMREGSRSSGFRVEGMPFLFSETPTSSQTASASRPR